MKLTTLTTIAAITLTQLTGCGVVLPETELTKFLRLIDQDGHRSDFELQAYDVLMDSNLTAEQAWQLVQEKEAGYKDEQNLRHYFQAMKCGEVVGSPALYQYGKQGYDIENARLPNRSLEVSTGYQVCVRIHNELLAKGII